ncbi:UDP-3-O-[3-hydroxymyristoyl] N-acetylglucosamine deacetylase [Rhodopirellula baltica SH28]|uniref:UDP-3-O-acyl-N-acetylglucosamine deacetylase n=1 Tax=Rhodopirellula baltica SH28 TaxID=993517 RepID=K5DZJ4_RHOBT|nr:UDP-3-O-acyl-N-acetylglucosamine deacetylase [Rhodopirellula baltica]EKJ98890.1 UDP-3-O-[3-hydroxymyristoyl] N-acetylglucosamine deacetylase [Rhodopirellula baltica SH28]
MMGIRNEHTIASCCEISGRGYWSGKDVRVTCCPAPAGTGIVLVRADLPGQPECPATTQYATGISFRTNLANGPATFEMVEHLMAALAGLEIDNCRVEITAEELPGLDGSSLAYVDALQEAGLVIQAATSQPLVIRESFRIEHSGGYVDVSPSTNNESTFEYSLDYGPDSTIREQKFRCVQTPLTFARQVASARTFVTAEQAQQLRASGVASHVTHQDLLVIGDNGPVDNQYRFRNECARHKTLDLIGDLSLAGVGLIGQFSSVRGGHQLNGMVAARLAQLAHQQRLTHHSIPFAGQRRNRAA